jgi:uncharacterized protein YjbJ (UPF0337 family)
MPLHCAVCSYKQESNMNQEQFAGNWNQLKGAVKAKWAKLTDDDLTQIQGKREHLVGRLQARYGKAADEIEREVDQFLKASQVSSAPTGQNR